MAATRVTLQRKWRNPRYALALLADMTELAFAMLTRDRDPKWDRVVEVGDLGISIARRASSLRDATHTDRTKKLIREIDQAIPKIKHATAKLIAPYDMAMIGHTTIEMLRASKVLVTKTDPDAYSLSSYLHPGDASVLEQLSRYIEVQAELALKLGIDLQSVLLAEARWRLIDRTNGRIPSDVGDAFEAVWAAGERKGAYQVLKEAP